MARALVAPRPATPPVYGLLVAAEVLNDPDMRWADGMTWAPEAGLNNVYSGVQLLDCGSNADRNADNADGVSDRTMDPLVVWSASVCSTFGEAARDWVGRATRQLLAVQSYYVAAELWDGAQADAASNGNEWLTGGNAEVEDSFSTAAAPVNALACVERVLAQNLYGQRGMVHMTPQLLTILVAEGAVYRDGRLWVTPNGHIVVADAGYSGNGPNGDNAGATYQWIFGTDMISVRLGPVEVLPGSMDDAAARAAAIDRTVNTVRVYADRLAAYQWDALTAVSAKVNVGICNG